MRYPRESQPLWISISLLPKLLWALRYLPKLIFMNRQDTGMFKITNYRHSRVFCVLQSNQYSIYKIVTIQDGYER